MSQKSSSWQAHLLCRVAPQDIVISNPNHQLALTPLLVFFLLFSALIMKAVNLNVL